MNPRPRLPPERRGEALVETSVKFGQIARLLSYDNRFRLEIILPHFKIH